MAWKTNPQDLSAEAATLQEIKQRGSLIVGVKDNLRPLGFRNAQGQLQGLEIEIAQRLGQELLGPKATVTLQPVTNPDRLISVIEGKVDLVIAGVSVTAARSRLVNFSPPYYSSGTALITKEPGIQRLSDLSSKTVAALPFSSTIPWLKYWLPKVNLMGVESYQEAYSQLEAGKVDAFAGDASVLTGWVQEFPQYRRLPVLLSAEPFAVVMPKGLQYDQLRRQVDTAIARWRQEGWLQQRATFWGLP